MTPPSKFQRDQCAFCDYEGPSAIDREWQDAYVIAPLREVVPGHRLVIPKFHAEDWVEYPTAFGLAAARAAEYAGMAGLDDANVITSRGPSASQTVRHLHLHILPREWGDGVTLPWGNPNLPPDYQGGGDGIDER